MPTKRDAPIMWRPPKALRARLEALATEQGVALTAVIQDLVERGLSILDGASVTAPKQPRMAKNPPGRGKRSVPCVHRRSPEDFCSRCDP